ncbi:MFS transporter [Polymorphobacter multimanifer]|uniref:MFS transporter n=1 Tax=Polymorphobacter multimanifer TaxID=1070431 RepID=UPI00237A87E9|nr:MFS transporter [Polymorphobacter multimanifer]
MLAFSAPCLPLAAVGLPVVVHLPPYYAGSLGLDIGVVGLIFFIVRIIDVPLDPILGVLIDRSKSRLGRFRPWLGGGAMILFAGVLAVFFAQPGISGPMAFAGLMLMYVGYSVVLVSHMAWGAVLSDDYHERSRIFGWWMAFNMVGMLAILAVPPASAALFGADRATGIQTMGIIIAAALVPTIILNIVAVPERLSRSDAGHAHGWREMVDAFRMPLLRRLLIVDLLANLAPGIAGALLLFFFEAARGYTPAQASLLLIPYFVAGLVAAPFWMALARRTSKHRAILWAVGLYMICQSGTLFIPRDDMALASLGMALAGIPYVAPAFLLRAMLADYSDAETLRSGKEQTGLFYALLTAVQKLGYAIPVGLTYPLLGLIGFDPSLGTANSENAITALTFLFIVPPVLIAGIGGLIIRGWPITAETQARNAEALAARS